MPADGKVVRGRIYQAIESRYEEVLVPLCDTIENADDLIPALVYEVGVTRSSVYKRLLPVVRQVPGRTDIRIRRGTKPEHSRGCIFVSGADERSLTARWLAEQTAHEETRIEICES